MAVHRSKIKVHGLECRVSSASAETSNVESRESRATLDSRLRRSRFFHQLSTPNHQLFFSGLVFGLAFLMKQQGVFFGIFGGLYLLAVPVVKYFEERELRKKNYGRLPKGVHGTEPVSW